MQTLYAFLLIHFSSISSSACIAIGISQQNET